MRARGRMARKQNHIYNTSPKCVDSNLTMAQIIGISHLCVCAHVYRGVDSLADIVGKWVTKIRYCIW